MAYRLRRKKSVETSLRKVATEQIGKAIGEINDERIDSHETVHQIRKRCKKLRGLIRLVRPVFEDYQRENTCFRDAARELSAVRDTQSLLECFDDLRAHFEQPLDDSAFSELRRKLVEQRNQVIEELDLDRKLDQFLTTMQAAKQRATAWSVEDEGFEAIEGGLKQTYRRARNAMHKAYANPSPERFHEWRKRVKYHWYHARLLRRIWKQPLKAHREESHRLADLLGDDHDLAIFRDHIIDQADWFDHEESRQALIALIDRRRSKLQSRARALGLKLLAEKPTQLADRFETYWSVWRVA